MSFAFIWDLDGTLLDSYGVIVPSLCEMLAEKGITVDAEEVRRFVIARSVKEYLAMMGEEKGFDFASSKERYSQITEMHMSDIRLMDGAREILALLSARGAEHYVLTHRGRTTQAVLERVGLNGLFRETVTSLNGFKRKPDPEGLNYLIGKYGLDRERCFYVGDRPLDVECARAAGVKSILYEPEPGLGLVTGREDHIVRRLADIAALLPAPGEIPEEIRALVGDLPYTVDGTGLSGSEVRLYENYVLKIQPVSAETDNEAACLRRLSDRLPLPRLYAYCCRDGLAYTLMSRLAGRMLCDAECLAEPRQVVRLAAEGLKALWQVDTSGWSGDVSRLGARLAAAEDKVNEGLVDIENAEPGTFGPEGFRDPAALLDWLKANRPEEDFVMTHGDYCLPNLFEAEGQLVGLIDLGKAGPADRWQDLALALRSLEHNFSGYYTDGQRLFDFEPQMLLDELGVSFDAAKYRYYLLLDELF